MSDAEIRTALVLIVIGLIGLFGPYAVVLAGRGVFSRTYMAIQLVTVGVFGSATVGVMWSGIYQLARVDLVNVNPGDMLATGWFITAASLGFVFTLTHMAYGLVVFLAQQVITYALLAQERWQDHRRTVRAETRNG